MKKSIKYYVVFPLLVISTLALTVLVFYNIYNLYSFKVYLIAPETKIMVSTEFTSTILIKGKRMPSEIEVYIGDRMAQRINANTFEYTDLGDLKIANLKIDPLYLPPGNHTMSVVLKGGWFIKDSRISYEFIYEKMNPVVTPASEKDVLAMKDFFAIDVSLLVSRLNNAREYYINSDWRTSDKYVEQKKKVSEANTDAGIKGKVLSLIQKIEDKAEIDDIYNTVNSLNLELYNKGYPIANLMFEYRYKNGSGSSLLLTYGIKDSVLIKKDNIKSPVYILERIDKLNITEQFLGIKLPNSPFSFILEESLNILLKRYSGIFGGDKTAAMKELRRMTDGYLKNEEELNILLESIREETVRYTRKQPLPELVRLSNAYHEIRHLSDYKEARRIGAGVPEMLKYFYDYTGVSSVFNVDSSYTAEKQICETLLKINPEYSAYLYELVHSDGLRRLVLLSLFERIINPDKEDTSHHWASKLIIYNLAKANNLPAGNLLTEQVSGKEGEWFGLVKKLIELPYEKIERDASILMLREFGG